MKLPGTYLDRFLLPVPMAKLKEYRQIATQATAIFDCKRMAFGGFKMMVNE